MPATDWRFPNNTIMDNTTPIAPEGATQDESEAPTTAIQPEPGTIAVSQETGNDEAPQGGTANAQQGGTANAPDSFDSHARAITEAMPDEFQRDALAARVIAAGGVQGVDLVSDVPTGEFAGHASAIQGHLQGLADAEVRRYGLEPQAFYDYLRNQGAAVVRSAALETYHLGKPGQTFNYHLSKFATKQRR